MFIEFVSEEETTVYECEDVSISYYQSLEGNGGIERVHGRPYEGIDELEVNLIWFRVRTEKGYKMHLHGFTCELHIRGDGYNRHVPSLHKAGRMEKPYTWELKATDSVDDEKSLQFTNWLENLISNAGSAQVVGDTAQIKLETLAKLLGQLEDYRDFTCRLFKDVTLDELSDYTV